MASTNGEAAPTPPPPITLPSLFRSFPPLVPFRSWFHSPGFDMNNDPGVQFLAARPRKRTHREMSDSHSRHPRHQDGSPSSSRPSSHSHRPSPPNRYAGDGLDFRRPATGQSSSRTNTVIDLTNEPDSPPQPASRRPRPPRFGREIMAEVVDLEDPSMNPPQDSPSSPEVQFVGASVRPQPPRTRRVPSSTDLLEIFRSRDRAVQAAEENAIRQELHRRMFNIAQQTPTDVDSFWIGDGPGGAIDLTINLDGLNMDYQLQGLASERGQRPSTYKPPSPAPEGFTRAIKEDNVVCCPNCDAELGTGDEIKQQIWVAKQCGHVYCGECATHRSKSSAKKTAQKVKPFAKCQVADCGKPVSSPKSMFQVYL